MIKNTLQQLRTAVMLLLALTLITGLAYPAVITGAAKALFPFQAGGSLIANGKIVTGSALIGQEFSETEHFWGRPSATTPIPYNAVSSSGSNLGPTNPAFLALMKKRTTRLRQFHGNGTVPAEMAMASGSGLDPHISPAAALYQVPRVAKATGLEENELRSLVEKHVEDRLGNIMGEPRVNVLGLNLDLHQLRQQKQTPGI